VGCRLNKADLLFLGGLQVVLGVIPEDLNTLEGCSCKCSDYFASWSWSVSKHGGGVLLQMQ